MSTKMGLWIDHKKAIVMALTDKGEEIGLIISKVDKQQPRSSIDIPVKGSHEAKTVQTDDRDLKSLAGHLNIFYDAVIACVRDVEFILIFGPNEAKFEFKTRLENTDFGGRIVGLEHVDKMTEHQIAAKVRQQFGH